MGEALEKRMVLSLNPFFLADANVVPAGVTVNGPIVSTGTVAFFSGSTGNGDYELWKTDGTTAGTVLVRDIRPNFGSSPSNLVNVNGVLAFTANDGVNGYQLWRSDGTAGGTVRVSSLGTSAALGQFTSVNGTLFFVATQAAIGQELWESTSGVHTASLVRDIRPGSSGSAPSNLTNVS